MIMVSNAISGANILIECHGESAKFINNGTIIADKIRHRYPKIAHKPLLPLIFFDFNFKTE